MACFPAGPSRLIISCSSRVIREAAARCITRSGSIRSRDSLPLLDCLHRVVGEPEMMTDLVDQHVADDMTERLGMLRPIIEYRSSIEENHRLMAGSRNPFECG